MSVPGTALLRYGNALSAGKIRTREGRPQEKVVALPVKDPYHIIRNVILIIELLERETKND